MCCYYSSVSQRTGRVTAARQGWQEKTHTAHVQRPTDLRVGEDLRADQIPGRARTREASIRAGNDGVASQGKLSPSKILLLHCTKQNNILFI